MYVQIHSFARLNTSKIMKFDSLWYLENENPSTTESWTDENFDLKNPRYEKKKSKILHLDPFARLGPPSLSYTWAFHAHAPHPCKNIKAGYGCHFFITACTELI